jgi:hypothetical protein
MSTTHPQLTARIESSPETIFSLSADIPNYGRWLKRYVEAQPKQSGVKTAGTHDAA